MARQSDRARGLRLRGRKWQLHRRLPKSVAKMSGKEFLVRALDTSDLSKAIRMRDRIWREVERLELQLRRDEAGADDRIIAELQAMSETERDAYEDVLMDRAEAMEEKGLDGEGWYKKVTGQSIAIEANIERFLHEVKVVPRTARARTTAIKRFAATTTKDVREVNRRDAGDFVSMLAREIRPGSVNSVLSGLSTYWAFMVKKGIVDSNPWQGQSLAKEHRTPEVWPIEDVPALIAKADPDLGLAIRLAFLHGLRAHEVAELRWSSFEEERLFRIRHSKTDAGVRSVWLHSQAKLPDRPDHDGWVKPRYKGKAGLLSQAFSAYRQKHGLPYKFHALRAAFIDSRLKAGVDLRLVQEAAGHRPTGVTLRHYYRGMTIDQLRWVIEAVRLPAYEPELSLASSG